MATEKEKMIAGELYRACDPELRAAHKRALGLTRQFNQLTEEQLEERFIVLKGLFGEVKGSCHIEPPFRCDYGFNITVGDRFFGNYDGIWLDIAPIIIGNNVMFGPRVSLYTASHPIDAEVRNSALEIGQPITIGDNVWLGGNVVVNPGVTIGDNVIVGSGAVVTKDIPADSIAGGNPCRVIRKITNEDTQHWQARANDYWNA